MKPILFPSYETAFTSQGLGALSDAISCVVREERNGEYELTMEYPVGGIHYDEIGDRCIIFAKPSPYRNPQPFRIYSVEVNINGIATIHAHHLSYDLSGIAVSPFNATSCATALSGLISHSVVDNPFTAWTDKAVDGTYKLTAPNSFRACLGGQENSILDVYGKGEYEFDTFDIKLHTNRGSDNGVLIAYGKNLTDFNMEKNLENVTTAVYPYWVDAEGNNLVELDEKIIQLYDPSVPIYLKESGGDFLAEVTNKLLVVHGVFDYDNVMVLDLSGEFEEQPSQYELFNRARKYIIDNQLARPRISIDVSFVDLASTEDYKDIAPIEQVDLCDIVTVRFPMVGIEVKAEIIAIETDVLLDRYNSVQIGDARTTLDMTLAQAMLAPTKEELKVGMASAADYINNTHGTFEWIDNGDDTNGGFTIYENGTSSWLRCTAGGIGISEDGGLTYTNAITKNGVVASSLEVKQNNVTLMSAKLDYYGEPQFKINGSSGNPVLQLGVQDGYPLFSLNNSSGTSVMEMTYYYIGGAISPSFKINRANGNNVLEMSSSTSDRPRFALKDLDGNETFYIENYATSSSKSAVEVSAVDPTTQNRIFTVSSGYDSSGKITATTLYVASPQSGLREVLLQSDDTYNSAGLSAFTSGGTEAVFLGVDGNSPKFRFNGHTASWQTKTISGVTINYLGY